MQPYLTHITKPYDVLTNQWNGCKPSSNPFVKRWEQLPLNAVRRPIIAIALVVITLASPILLATGALHHAFRNFRKVEHIVPKQPTIDLPEIEDDSALDAIVVPSIQPGGKREIMEGGCDRFFDPEIFNEYRKRFKDQIPPVLFTKAEKKDALVQDWYKLVVRFNQNCPTREHARAWHIAFTNELRDLSRSVNTSDSEVHKKLQKTLEEWMFNRYFKLDIHDILESELNRLSDFADKPAKEAMSIHKGIDSSGKLKKGIDVTSEFDAHFYGNQPFSIPSIKLGDGHVVEMVRMPSVTRDVERVESKKHIGRFDVTGVEIIEEFKLLLGYLNRAGQTHLYVNLMSRTDGNEAIRAKKFEEYSNGEGSNLIVMTLDKDSPFWYQTGGQDQKAADFKAEFIAKMFEDKGRFFFSNSIDRTWLKDQIAEILDVVHSTNFGSREILTPNDKRNFIEMSYCHLIERVMMKYHPKTANLSCKHCIDRGAGQIVSFFSYMRHKGLSAVSDLFLKTISFIPSVLVSNRLTPGERFQRTANMMEQYSPA